jgi:ATP-dependent RNA helicase RhlE
VKTLVATDIAARGIDVDGISHVVNFDLPNIPETYVHRIGRTARAGADGTAISLCDREELAFLRDIEKLIGKSIPSDNRPRANGNGSSAHRGAGARHEPSRGEPRRRHDDSAVPAGSAQEQVRDAPHGASYASRDAVRAHRAVTAERPRSDGGATAREPPWGRRRHGRADEKKRSKRPHVVG